MPSQTLPDNAQTDGQADDLHAAPSADEAFALFGAALRQHFPSRDALLAEACAQTAARRRKRRQLGGTIALAIATCTLGAIAWQNPVLSTQTLQTAVGEQRHVALPDGSSVVLNTDTGLTVTYRLRSRDLRLERGEAAFTVVSGWRPFVVRSGPIWVRDIGTIFQVRRTENDNQVTVLEGLVEVARLQADGAPAPARLRLHARQSLRIADDAAQSTQAPRNIDPTQAMAWQHGRLVFDGAPLSQVIAEMGRYRMQRITLADDALAALRLSGVYDIDDLDALLDALPRALPLAVMRQPDDSVVIQALPSAGRRERTAK